MSLKPETHADAYTHMVDCGVMSLARGDGDGGRRGVKGERGESLFMKQNIKKSSFLRM
jgi:hypothetical protein